MSDKLAKDSQVEVTSDVDGFVGAWFSAILLDNPTKSLRKKLRVRYTTLLDTEGSSSLIETVDQSHIRPVPPEDLYGDVVLKDGLMVDVDDKDGWWTGLLIKKIEDSEKHLVYFDSPPDVVEFDTKLLRPHLDWTDSKWVRPDIKELDKSIFSTGRMVEVSSAKDKVEVSWFPAMMIKEIKVNGEKKFIVKDCNGHEARANTIVDHRRVRPTAPPFSCESYTLLECVEAFRDSSGWRRGMVKGILSEKRYMVSMEATKEESVYKHWDLRPLKVWEDGVWHDGPKRCPIKENTAYIKKKKPMRSSPHAKPMPRTKDVRRSPNPGENGETLTKAATGELTKKRAAALINVLPAIESISPGTPSPAITATSLRQEEPQAEGRKSREKNVEPMKNQNGLGNGSTLQKMLGENCKEATKKRKREENHSSYLKETDETSTGSKAEINGTSQNVGVDAATDVNETPSKDTQLRVLPFVKKSPIWKKFETKENYCILPQAPHFSPLVEAKEDFREGLAIGMMVTFCGLLEEIKDLQLDVSSSKLSSLSSSFAELEKHGFDVEMPQARISKVVSLQDGLAKEAEKRKCIEKKLEAEKSERHKFEEEILELKRKEAVAIEKKEGAEKRIVEMESNAETIDRKMEDMELEFITTVSAPW